MNITNLIRLEWSVSDPVYPYQSSYEYTTEEYAALDMAAVKEQQEQEYAAWLENLKAMEQGQ
jgi:hypothetical protein